MPSFFFCMLGILTVPSHMKTNDKALSILFMSNNIWIPNVPFFGTHRVPFKHIKWLPPDQLGLEVLFVVPQIAVSSLVESDLFWLRWKFSAHGSVLHPSPFRTWALQCSLLCALWEDRNNASSVTTVRKSGFEWLLFLSHERQWLEAKPWRYPCTWPEKCWPGCFTCSKTQCFYPLKRDSNIVSSFLWVNDN